MFAEEVLSDWCGYLDPTSRPDLVRPFFMGLFTGMTSAVVLLPSEVIKAKTQVMVGNDMTSSTDV